MSISSVSIVPNVETHISSDKKVSIFQILPEGTIVWVKDLQLIIDKLQTCFEQASKFADNLTITDEEEVSRIIRERTFIKPKDVVEDLQSHRMVFLEQGDNAIFSPTAKIAFEAIPQPSFNKNFDMLISDLNQHQKESVSDYSKLFMDYL